MKLRFWLGIALSAIIVLFIVRQVDFNQLFGSLRSANYALLGLAVFVLLLTLLLKAWRWHYLMLSIQPIRIYTLLSITTIGAMIDMVLPARTGDVVRAYMLGQKEDVSKMASLATIVVEKVLDVLVILLVSVPMLALIRLPGGDTTLANGVRMGVYVITALCAGLVIGFFMLRSKTEMVIQFAERSLFFLPDRWVQGLQESLHNFAMGLQTIQSSRHLAFVLFQTVVLWSTYALSNYLILEAFALDVPVYAAFLFLIFQVLGVTVPSSPGFIGTYHAAVVVGFSLLGTAQETALSVAIIMHAAFFFPFILFGLFFLWRDNLSFRTLRTVDTAKA